MDNEPASVADLITKIRVQNLVPVILKMKRKTTGDDSYMSGEDILSEIAERVIEDREADKKSMETWEKYLEVGRKLQVQDLVPKAEPFEGAANFKSPAMLEASLRFGDRASSTLLKPRDLVRYDVIGPDPEKEKDGRGKRVSTHMNYQLNYEMPTWREDFDATMYMLPSDGAVFKYTYFDSGLGENVSEVIRWPDFCVNQANTSMELCRSFTIDREFSKSTVLAKQREGIWHEYEDHEMGTETQDEQNTASESTDKFYIQQMFYDLDDDGYEEPYIVTVHENTNKIMRMVARFEEDNIMVKTPNGKVISLDKVLAGADELGMNVSGDAEKDQKNSRISQVSLVRINPINCITDYSFIPGALIPFEKEGSFLGIGYVHLLAGITQAINSTSNTILNSGKLASTPGGFLAKGFRKAKGALKFKLGEYLPTLMSPADLQDSIRDFSFPDVKESYFLFNDKMRAEIERLAASADVSEAIGANAPATTMLGIVQEKMVPLSSITMRIYRSMKKEYIKLANLNKKYTDPAVYKDLQENPEASYIEDYGLIGLDVMPAANPEMTSKLQNMLQSQAVLDQADRILQYGGNPIPVMKRWLEDLDYDDVDSIFPSDEKQTDPNLEALRKAQDVEQQLAQKQTELFGEQVKNEKAKTAIEKAKAVATIKETISKVILNLEKAESEEVKNQISEYTTHLEGLAAQLAPDQPNSQQ